ncbi:uncharacterized protein [Sinocyclocheilus grahami]|uniref:uncharacterized protein n=1 Tax=Sinocyclocheilus grahami TaxID=75366 RepID=UPI0007AD4D61|nr:PREDICTED: uncharacterized protein LOC107591565 [Sinocyclocheilus grahami]
MRTFLLPCHDNWMLLSLIKSVCFAAGMSFRLYDTQPYTLILPRVYNYTKQEDRQEVVKCFIYVIKAVSEVGWPYSGAAVTLSFTMTRSGAFKLSIVFFLAFILCLPEFFPEISQIEFLCELFDPCTPENDAQVCTPADPPCETETINASIQNIHADGWYLCKTEMDLQLLYNNTSQSGEHIKVVLKMKAGNLSGWNIDVFAFLNNTDLYTGPQNDQRLFYCYLPPDDSKCPDLDISMHENTSTPTQDTSILKTITSANPAASSLKTTTLSFQATASTNELRCQPASSSSFLFYYQEQNETARSAAFPATQTRRGQKFREQICEEQKEDIHAEIHTDTHCRSLGLHYTVLQYCILYV